MKLSFAARLAKGSVALVFKFYVLLSVGNSIFEGLTLEAGDLSSTIAKSCSSLITAKGRLFIKDPYRFLALVPPRRLSSADFLRLGDGYSSVDLIGLLVDGAGRFSSYDKLSSIEIVLAFAFYIIY